MKSTAPALDWPTILRRLAIWGVFAGILWLLRGFFPVVFLTFVFGYAAEHAILALEKRLPKAPRTLLAAGVFLGAVLGLSGLMIVLIPRVEAEIEGISQEFPKHAQAAGEWYEEMKAEHPSIAKFGDTILAELKQWPERTFGPEPLVGSAPASKSHLPDINSLMNVGLKVITSIVSAGATIFFALLFALLIVFDLPNLRKEVEAIEASRVGWLYSEVRSTVVEFGASVGHILEAQALIAVVNTVFTSIGLWILGVPSVLLLGVIVFFCGFIPVAGTFISSLPIVLIAAGAGGLVLAIKAVALIIAVHFFEAYVLEPRIFGKHFRFNPVFVLLVLFVGHKLADIWGLLLSLPVAYSLLRPQRKPRPLPVS